MYHSNNVINEAVKMTRVLSESGFSFLPMGSLIWSKEGEVIKWMILDTTSRWLEGVMKHLFCSSAITLISQNCSVIESSPQALNSGVIMRPFNYYVRPLEANAPIWTPPIPATQTSALQSLSTRFLECVSRALATSSHQRLSAREWLKTFFNLEVL